MDTNVPSDTKKKVLNFACIQWSLMTNSITLNRTPQMNNCSSLTLIIMCIRIETLVIIAIFRTENFFVYQIEKHLECRYIYMLIISASRSLDYLLWYHCACV